MQLLATESHDAGLHCSKIQAQMCLCLWARTLLNSKLVQCLWEGKLLNWKQGQCPWGGRPWS